MGHRDTCPAKPGCSPGPRPLLWSLAHRKFLRRVTDTPWVRNGIRKGQCFLEEPRERPRPALPRRVPVTCRGAGDSLRVSTPSPLFLSVGGLGTYTQGARPTLPTGSGSAGPGYLAGGWQAIVTRKGSWCATWQFPQEPNAQKVPRKRRDSQRTFWDRPRASPPRLPPTPLLSYFRSNISSWERTRH